MVEDREAIARRGDLIEARVHLAGIYLERGDSTRARDELQTALEQDPSDPRARELLGKMR